MENFRLLSGVSDGTSLCSKIYQECTDVFMEILNKENFIHTTIFPIIYEYNGKKFYVNYVRYYYDDVVGNFIYTSKITCGKFTCDVKYNL